MKRRVNGDKFKRAKQYIDNNLGPTEFLALCYDLYDFEHGVNNKPSGPFNKTLDVLGMWDETRLCGRSNHGLCTQDVWKNGVYAAGRQCDGISGL